MMKFYGAFGINNFISLGRLADMVATENNPELMEAEHKVTYPQLTRPEHPAWFTRVTETPQPIASMDILNQVDSGIVDLIMKTWKVSVLRREIEALDVWKTYENFDDDAVHDLTQQFATFLGADAEILLYRDARTGRDYAIAMSAADSFQFYTGTQKQYNGDVMKVGFLMSTRPFQLVKVEYKNFGLKPKQPY